MTLRSPADRQEGPPGDHLGGGLRGPPAETAEGQTDAERDGRVYPREVTGGIMNKSNDSLLCEMLYERGGAADALTSLRFSVFSG